MFDEKLKLSVDILREEVNELQEKIEKIEKKE